MSDLFKVCSLWWVLFPCLFPTAGSQQLSASYCPMDCHCPALGSCARSSPCFFSPQGYSVLTQSCSLSGSLARAFFSSLISWSLCSTSQWEVARTGGLWVVSAKLGAAQGSPCCCWLPPWAGVRSFSKMVHSPDLSCNQCQDSQAALLLSLTLLIIILWFSPSSFFPVHGFFGCLQPRSVSHYLQSLLSFWVSSELLPVASWYFCFQMVQEKDLEFYWLVKLLLIHFLFEFRKGAKLLM